MKVLITGASGHVGSHTAATLVDQGVDVRALARTPDRVRRALAPFGASDRVEIVPGDMIDAETVAAAVAGCDCGCAHRGGRDAGAAGRGRCGVEPRGGRG